MAEKSYGPTNPGDAVYENDPGVIGAFLDPNTATNTTGRSFVDQRVESLTKLYGVRQIITREVFDRVAKKPECRFLDRVRVKGKSRPLELYEVLINPVPDRLALRDRYESAWTYYEHGDFRQALDAFQGIKETDRAGQLLWKRCEELIATSPPS